MRIMHDKSNIFNHTELHIRKNGIEMRITRRRTYGGRYNRNIIFMPWPWLRKKFR